jgi:Fic family protein
MSTLSFRAATRSTYRLKRALAVIERAREELVAPTGSQWLKLRRQAEIQEARATLALDGITLDGDAKRLRLPPGLRRSRDGAVKAFRFAHTPRATQEPLYGAVVVREYHRLLFRGTDEIGTGAGNYRTVRKSGTVPPNEVARGVREMTDWLNDWTALSPVVAASVVQARMAELAPFGHGDLRVGRALALDVLAQHGHGFEGLLAPSIAFTRQTYDNALKLAVGDTQEFVEFFAEGLAAAACRLFAATRSAT